MLTIIMLLFIISSSIHIISSIIINDEVIILETSQTQTVTLFIGGNVPSAEGVVVTSKIGNLCRIIY